MPYESPIDGIELYRFPSLVVLDATLHFVSTRTGGVSLPPYDTLNLGLHVGDDPEAVDRNRDRLCKALAIERSSLTFGRQTHGARVQLVASTMRGRGSRDERTAFEATDGLVTAAAGVCLGVLVADCVPVLMCDPTKGVIAALHAGWRGTAAAIVPRAVTTMTSRFGCAPREIRAALGPAIGADDYEVGPDVVAALKAAMPRHWRRAVRESAAPSVGPRLDLREANRLQLLECGVTQAHIEIAEESTYASRERYYSARRDGVQTGRFVAGIMLRP